MDEVEEEECEAAEVVGERSQLGNVRLSRARAETEKVGGEGRGEGRWVPGVVMIASEKWMRRGAREGRLAVVREERVFFMVVDSFGILAV